MLNKSEQVFKDFWGGPAWGLLQDAASLSMAKSCSVPLKCCELLNCCTSICQGLLPEFEMAPSSLRMLWGSPKVLLQEKKWKLHAPFRLGPSALTLLTPAGLQRPQHHAIPCLQAICLMKHWAPPGMSGGTWQLQTRCHVSNKAAHGRQDKASFTVIYHDIPWHTVSLTNPVSCVLKIPQTSSLQCWASLASSHWAVFPHFARLLPCNGGKFRLQHARPF